MPKLIKTAKQIRVAKYMLSEWGDLGTTNPHWTATEVNVSDSMVHGFFRKLRKANVLVTQGHEQGGRCIDPDTRALCLAPGPAFPTFLAEAVAHGIRIPTYAASGVEPGTGLALWETADKCVADHFCGYGLMVPADR